MRAAAIVPAHNEEKTISEVVETLRIDGFEVCVVDDGSTDATAGRAENSGATVLRLATNIGVGGAIRCGFRWARENGFDALVQVDGDGQHPPDLAKSLLAYAERIDCDLLVGSRYQHRSGSYPVGAVKRLAIGMLARRVRRTCGVITTDPTSGFRVFRGPIVDFFASSYPVDFLADTVEALMMAGIAGYRVAEAPVSMRVRSEGEAHAGSLALALRTVELSLVLQIRGRKLVPARPLPQAMD